MAPNRKARASQQPPPQASDYETDAPPAVEVPRPPPRSNEELNFKVLSRIYPDLVTIEHVTPYAVLYSYKLETQQWEKLGIEGTLFICRLTPSPIGAERFCAIIHNRRGLDNFYQELTNSEEMEVSDPYVIMHGEDVFGIWIFADPPPASTANCRVETAAKMMEYAGKAKASREALQPTSTAGEDVEDAEDASASSAAMGRQLSLRELFGQQREQDAGFTIHNHNSQPAAAQSDVLGGIARFGTWPKASTFHTRYIQDISGPAQKRVPSGLSRWQEGSEKEGSENDNEIERWSTIVGYLLYDVTWALLRSLFIFVMYWLASREKNTDKQVVYILLSIQVLQLDAALKDYWYGSLKKGCRCSHRRLPDRCYESRAVVV